MIQGFFNALHKKYSLQLRDYLIIPKEDLRYSEDNLFTYNNADFQHTEEFKEIYDLVKKVDDGKILSRTNIRWRIHVMCWAAARCLNLRGDFVECGVNTGMFAKAVIQKTNFDLTNKLYYLLDTFDGLDPRYSTEYELEAGNIMGYGRDPDLYDKVRKSFEGHNCKIIKGTIPETLSEITSSEIAYACVDLNSVLPETKALEYLWPKLVEGGILVLDDYANPGRHEQKAAHDAFAESVGTEVLSLPTGQGLLLKTGV